MSRKRIRSLIAFIVCIVLAVVSISVASLIESDFGRVSVEQIRIPITTNNGISAYIPAKLYIPDGVDSSNPAPAVLLMHGYQNDKDTSAAFAVELARRKIVALSIDEFGHGESPIGMRNRGYDTSKSGPNRFKMFMSFSKLNFDNVKGLIDSSMGGTAAFRWLQSRDYVQAGKVGITGHSMGTWSAYTVAAENPDHAAIVIQCGEVEGPVIDDDGNVRFRNVLLLQAQYDEFDYFRDYQLTTENLNKTELRYKIFCGQDAPVEWNKTYGSFADGTARRMEFLNAAQGVTHSSRVLPQRWNGLPPRWELSRICPYRSDVYEKRTFDGFCFARCLDFVTAALFIASYNKILCSVGTAASGQVYGAEKELA